MRSQELETTDDMEMELLKYLPESSLISTEII